MRHMRKQDRIANWEKYPQLFYPDIYLLHGGYHSFFKEQPDHCEPRNYVSMFDSNYTQICRGEVSSARQRDVSRSLSFSGPFGGPAPGLRKKRKIDKSKEIQKENIKMDLNCLITNEKAMNESNSNPTLPEPSDRNCRLKTATSPMKNKVLQEKLFNGQTPNNL